MIVKMFILLCSHFMMMARVCLHAMYPSRWSVLSPPPISPIAAPSEEQKEHEDNKNEVHIFLQNIWRESSLLYMWVQNYYLPASDLYLCRFRVR